MTKKNVLLLVPPSKRLYQNDNYCSFSSKASYYAPPLDLLIMSGYLHGVHGVEVLDARAERMDADRALRRISSRGCDDLIFVTGYASWKDDMEFIRQAKEAAGCRTLASGGFLLFHGEEALRKFPALDAVCLDFTTPRLLEYIGGGGGAVADFLIRRDGVLLNGGRSQAEAEFEVPIPRHELFPLRRYALPYARFFPFSRVMTSMGCPHRCHFCSHASVPFKKRSIPNTVDELRHLAALRVRQIYFTDPTFVVGRERTSELCRAIIAERLGLSWSCNTRVDSLDAPLLRLMKEAGCQILQLGVESANLNVLRRAEKRIELDRIRDAFRMCREAGVQSMAYFILGLPGDTRETIMETIALSRQLDADYASFTIATPDFGTRLRNEAIEKGWIAADTDVFDSTGYPVMEMPGIAKEELWRLKNKANRAFYLRPRYLARALLSVRSPRNLAQLARNGYQLLRNMSKRAFR